MGRVYPSRNIYEILYVLTSEEDTAAESNMSHKTGKSGLTSIFGKRAMHDSHETWETKSDAGQMQEVLGRQSAMIQQLSDQLKEQGRRQKQLIPQSSHQGSTKMGCVFSGHRDRVHCHSLVRTEKCHSRVITSLCKGFNNGWSLTEMPISLFWHYLASKQKVVISDLFEVNFDG